MRVFCRLLFYLLLTLSTRLAADRNCFFNETRKIVYYTDTPVRAVLQPITTLIGGWQSATVSMYITKILLEEKMGVEVKLWPTSIEDYTAWYAYNDTDYPVTQYQWLNDGEIDYIIEGWELTRPRPRIKEIFDQQNIKEIGNLGTVGQMYIFVPDYTIKEHSTLGWYESLHEQEVIDIFLNDSLTIFNKYKGSVLFTRYNQWSYDSWANGSDFRFNLTKADNTTKQTRPFIFGFIPTYQMSMDLWDRMHMLGLNDTWDLWLVQSEGQLTALMEEMIANEMNFIAHLYSPTNDMGEFAWEKINFPFPQKTDCYEYKTCEEKLDVLFKTVNVAALAEFPEVLTFLSRVRLSNIDVNAMIAASNQDETSSVWNSVCTWLKENPDWVDWIVDIKRDFPTRLDLDHDVMIVMWFAVAIVSALTLLGLIYLLENKEKSLIRAVSPAFLALAAVSGILVAFAGGLWTLDDYEYGLPICATRWIFVCTGNTVLFSSLSLKTWRVWHIFKNQGKGVTNCELYRLIVLVYIPVAGLLIWKTIQIYDQGLQFEIAEDGIEYQYECPDTDSGVYLVLSQWIIAFIALFFCLKARDVPDDFNENVHIMYLCIFTMLLMGFGVIVFQSAGDTPKIRAIIVCLSHLMAAVVIEITVLGRTMYLLVSGKAERHIRSEIELDEVGTTDY